MGSDKRTPTKWGRYRPVNAINPMVLFSIKNKCRLQHKQLLIFLLEKSALLTGTPVFTKYSSDLLISALISPARSFSLKRSNIHIGLLTVSHILLMTKINAYLFAFVRLQPTNSQCASLFNPVWVRAAYACGQLNISFPAHSVVMFTKSLTMGCRDITQEEYTL